MDDGKKQEIYRLRTQDYLTYRQIADKLGVSYQTVGTVLNKDFGLFGDRIYHELHNPTTFENNPDCIVAIMLGASESKVTKSRIALGMTRYYIVDILKRRFKLSQSLFGMQPGKEFSSWIIDFCMDHFTLIQAALIVDFYITGKEISLSRRNNKDSNRVYRSWTMTKFRDLVSGIDKTDLIRKGVLNESSIECQ